MPAKRAQVSSRRRAARSPSLQAQVYAELRKWRDGNAKLEEYTVAEMKAMVLRFQERQAEHSVRLIDLQLVIEGRLPWVVGCRAGGKQAGQIKNLWPICA